MLTPSRTDSGETNEGTDMIDQLISLADAHRDADEYVAGHYEWRGAACAIGCTI